MRKLIVSSLVSGPEGRHEGDASQTWIRRHDEYA